MSDTVTIFDPQGVARDIPSDMLQKAVSMGGKPAVRVQAPDGTVRAVPADRLPDVTKNGGKVLPFQPQEAEHVGLWKRFTQDLGGLLTPSGVSPYPGMDVEAKQALLAQGQQQDQSRQAAGYSGPYRVLAAGANGIGVNAAGMEQSAAEGDVGGVLGHAAAPIAVIGAAELMRHGGVPESAKPVVRGAVRGANTLLAKAPMTVGAAVGGGIGGYFGGATGAELGGAIGAGIGREVLPKVQIPGADYGLPPKPPAPEPVVPSVAPEAQPATAKVPIKTVRQAKVLAGNVPLQQSQGLQSPEPAPTPNAQVTPNVTVLRTKPIPQAPVDPVKALQQAQALRGPTNDVVAAALPDASKFVQAKTQAEVNLHLRNGDVEAAQAALDKATGKTPADRAKALRDSLNELDGESGDFVKPQPTIHNGSLYEYKGGQFYKDGKVLDSGADIADAVNALEARRKGLDIEGQGTLRPEQPKQLQGQVAPKSDFPPPAPTNPGTTNDIRANLPENRAKRLTESRDDAGVSQEMNWDLQRHRFMAESEARKEFIARNSTGTTKGDLVRQAGGNVPEQPVKYTKNKLPKSPSASEDLTDILQQSLDAAKKRKQAGQ